MNQKLFGITGWKNSGKTTMTERLVTCLTARGYRIATIKHAHHNFDIDHEGTDSWRHRKAGAAEVAIVSSQRYAIMHENLGEEEPSLREIAAKLAPCDLVLVEGYKRETHKKIELRRQGSHHGPALSRDDPTIVAIASDQPQPGEAAPVFDINDIEKIADFIEGEMAL
ncbi:molybdopterin-guanine dinucleotide biosynthesis protein B [Brucella ciceri]|uniref:molybdopterin-guanine dinucleotide biosynthesis protein B n=1 Tax=Brucella ciceri TaxID=391287 RepID=UPI000DDC0D91|nr:MULTISPECIES: molybdopterin-guanine dinucleotide biosynthesis protein B [Brucella/Ochrobactrum group]MBA8842936.1 molybdopterin-guanine dinucleotide biosynthesis protein B [Ochrobactrum sp. RH1CCR137]MBA8854829.1 molybdopterin-guanine dinucleotide biosynthesis protein B [Ochrobactrum sp. RH1CCR134]MCH6203909.1 molybdopterin-guanine dinucleotide biosynthesis protein B [Brucella ciceri]